MNGSAGRVEADGVTADGITVRLLCGFTLILGLCTWRLWWPASAFPRVPLLRFATSWPLWWDGVLVLGLCLLLIASAVVPHREGWRRGLLGTALLVWAGLIIGDQHRLQPWSYHFAVSAWVLVCLPGWRGVRWLRALLISVYVYSALSKFDARFLATNGTLFVQTGLEMLGVQAQAWPAARLARFALLLPLGELMVGLTLAWPRLRKLGVVLAVILHGSLFILLSPLGLNHRWGVLVWNISFACQAVWLFAWAKRASDETTAVSGDAAGRLRYVASLPVLAALALPVLEPFGCWDSWLAWGLYSVRAPQAEVWIAAQEADKLPPVIRSYCEPTEPGTVWARLALDRWSLDAVQAPLYPHPRFQLGVASAVMDALPNDNLPLMVRIEGVPDRWTGIGSSETFYGRNELRVLLDGFALNAHPRHDPDRDDEP